MIINISERVARIGLLVINCLFISAGLSMVIHGIYKKVTTKTEISKDVNDSQADGSSSILAGSFDIIIGVCGLVGALLKKRILMMINMGLLTVSIIGNIVVLILYVVTNSQFVVDTTNTMRLKVSNNYGNNSDPESRDITLQIDEHQKQDACCGWSGIDGENLFLKSPWYKQINLNVTALPRTLPDSCCNTAGDDCRATTDLKEARKQGYVNKYDCLDRMIGRSNFFMWVTIVQLLIVTVMQLLVLGFSVLCFLQNPGGGGE